MEKVLIWERSVLFPRLPDRQLNLAGSGLDVKSGSIALEDERGPVGSDLAWQLASDRTRGRSQCALRIDIAGHH